MALFSDPATGIADPLLRRAYVLAERGRGTTSPNPVVGCVIARDGAVVGEGFHERAGGPHAEVAALRAAGEAARGADVYVTLEPCAHFGRTPPCADALLAAGVSSVTIGMRDPDERVSGGGADLLASSGVAVRWAEEASVFAGQNAGWLTRIGTGRPFVRVKVALTLDGRPALVARRRSRITGAGGRSVTMRLRADATAVAIGASTLSIDDPLLTCRDAGDRACARTPRRIVLSRTSVPSADANVFADGRGCMVVVSDAVAPEALDGLAHAGASVVRYPYAGGLSAALRSIGDAGIDDLLVEAGPGLFTALWRERLINELVVVTAGGMGGGAGPALYVGAPDSDGGDLSPLFEPVEAGIVEGDAVIVWRPRGCAPWLREGEC